MGTAWPNQEVKELPYAQALRVISVILAFAYEPESWLLHGHKVQQLAHPYPHRFRSIKNAMYFDINYVICLFSYFVTNCKWYSFPFFSK